MSQRFSPSSMLTTGSMLSWSASLMLPAIEMGVGVAYGWQFLLYGWQGIATLNIGGLSWLTNPLLLITWVSFFAFRRHRTWTAALAFAALLASLTSFLFNALGSEQGGLRIEHFALGFYLWLLSALLQAVAAMVRSREE